MQPTATHRLLVLADPYGKPSYAPRLRSICEHLAAQGWQVDVYTEQWQPLDFKHDNYTITTIPFYRNKGIDWAIKAFWSLLTEWKERKFAREVSRLIAGKQYDAVLCTTFSTFPLGAALQIARQNHLPLIADIRDIDEQAPNSQYQAHRQWWARLMRGWYRRTYIRRRNRVLRQAQLVTTISPWHVEYLKQFNPNVVLVYNGFDKDAFFPTPTPVKTFDIVYTGRIYESELQDPKCFFEGLSLLPEMENFRVVWYTNAEGQERINAYVKQYGIRCEMLFNDYVNPVQIPQILNQSSMVLVFSHPAGKQGPHGIMTTKFYEALGVEKPVLCAPSDEECLEAVIRETNAGIAARTPQEVSAFIQDKYNEWLTNGYTRQKVNTELKQRFTRQSQAQQFEQLITDTIAPLVSVIVPVYNAADYLTECVQSLIEQDTASPLQIILVDDGSTDSSLSLIRQFAESKVQARQVMMLTQPHSGQGVARNLGLQHATGSFICFLDADDRLEKDFVSRMHTATVSSDVVQCGYRRVKNDGTIIVTKQPRHFYQFVSPCMRLYKSELLHDVRFPEGMIYEDVIFSLRLWAKRPESTIIPYIGYNYRLNNVSTTSRVDRPAQRKLYATIRATQAPLWLKLYTIIRLKIHFLR